MISCAQLKTGGVQGAQQSYRACCAAWPSHATEQAMFLPMERWVEFRAPTPAFCVMCHGYATEHASISSCLVLSC